MSLLRRMLRPLSDWRNGATLVASVLVALIAFIVIDAHNARLEAFRALNDATEQGIDIRQAQSKRITALLDEIRLLRDGQVAAAEQAGELRSQIDALRLQIEALGGTPIMIVGGVDVQPATTVGGAPSAHPEAPQTPATTGSGPGSGSPGCADGPPCRPQRPDR